MKVLKIKFIIIFLFGIFGLHNLLFAQKVALPDRIPGTPADTLYYFFDKNHSSDTIRMTKTSSEVFEKFFKINCGCLYLDNKSYEDKNILLNSLTKQDVIINESKFKSLKMITLTELIDFIKTHNGIYFGKNAFGGAYIVYIIEPGKNGFILHNVHNASFNNVTVE
ncbi:hypothetical protein [Mucilaginibacter sp. UYCu711]|uniref:hypothetical protein n=1 Tax=Mucilaginibacter sp. UYCu711 TaxID=3156339 RepID=UPI003D2467EA